MNGHSPNKISISAKGEKVLTALTDVSLQAASSVVQSLKGSLDGLSQEEVEKRQEEFGPNIIISEKPRSWYYQLFQCFLNPFNLVLSTLAFISLLAGDLESVVLMMVIVLISVSIRFFQEYRSGKEAERLKSLVQITATVQRIDELGQVVLREILVSEVVPGDIISLSSGDMVPADVRLISSRDLFVSQSMLTGESLPVEKNDHNGGENINAFDRPNIAFMGTNVMSGIAKAIAVVTGNNTYLGSLAKSIIEKPVPTSFDKGISNISWILIRFIFSMAPLVFFINGFTKGNWLDALMFSISIAVGLTPEMLPMIVTANLAKGANRLARSKVVVKRLNSMHNLGAMDVLCTDKTGTLTQNKIILHNHLNIEGDNDDEVFKYGYLNSINQTGLKNLLDIAVLEEAEKNYRTKTFSEEIAQYQVIDELPFDFVRRRMSVIVEDAQGRHILICKGATEELLSVCTDVENPDGSIVPLTDQLKSDLRQMVVDLNEDGFRVLVVAYHHLAQSKISYKKEDEKNLIVKGLLTFLDPPKKSAYTAIPKLLGHGVRIKVLTGDNAVVTRKICYEVGIKPEPMLLGQEIESMTDKELELAVRETTVFAKVSPLQKSRIIQALKATGHTVGFLGDGVNDAPALREADVGISVDTAVDIAKESADMILLEKSLMVIDEGVIEGRKTFINIIKYIKMALSSNFGNMFSVLGAAIILPFLPMLPLQLLIQNLLYDISQLAIPFDKVDKHLLQTPRHWLATDLGRFMLFVGPISSIFDYVTFGMLWFYFGANSIAEHSFFQTGWFVEGLITQTLIIHMIRTPKIPFLEETASLPLILSTTFAVALGIWLPFSPFASSMGMIPLPAKYFAFLCMVMIGYWGIVSLLKRWYIKRFGTWL